MFGLLRRVTMLVPEEVAGGTSVLEFINIVDKYLVPF